MPDNFRSLIDRVHTGDDDAAVELVRRFEPLVRREVRAMIRRHRTLPLNRILDSADICQSVMARFFERALTTGVKLDDAEHLANLLIVMARNRFLQHSRNNQAHQRDIRRTLILAGIDLPEPKHRENPADQAIERELLNLIENRLSADERAVAARRTLGQSWNEIASALGGSPDGRRMQLFRAEARIADELGMSPTQQDGT